MTENTWIELWKDWRTIAAHVFLTVIFFDFIIFPALTQFEIGFLHAAVQPWIPLTTGSGGMFFIAFSSILSISAFGKMKEKISELVGTDDTQPTK